MASCQIGRYSEIHVNPKIGSSAAKCERGDFLDSYKVTILFTEAFIYT